MSASDHYDFQSSKSSRMANQESGPNSIRVEESIDCRSPSNSRLFLMKNLDTVLDITINQNSTITSCRLDGHEIIVNPRLLQQRHDTWAQNIPSLIANSDTNERTNSTTTYRHHAISHRVQTFPWNSHVRGSELILSTSNNSSSILYELTSYNELINTVKLKTIHAQHQPIYFNLNDAKEKESIEGHTMSIQCNGNINRIQVQQTNLVCNCNTFSSMSPRSFIREVPVEIVAHNGLNPITLQPIDNISKINDDDLIICDAIFSLESTCSLDVLIVQLQYQRRKLVIELRCNQVVSSQSQSTPSSSSSLPTSHSSDRVSSSTTTLTSQKSRGSTSESKSVSQINIDSRHMPVASEVTSPGDSMQRESTQEGSSSKGVKSDSLSDVQANEPSDSSHDNKRTKLSRAQNNTDPPAYLSHNATLRLRVRVTNFGVCIVPFQMSQYTCSYKFSW